MKKYDKKFTNWLRDKKYTFKLESWCKHCKNLKKKFTNSKNIPIHTKKTKHVPVPAIFKNNKHLPNESVEDLYNKYISTNGFGSRRGINTKPSGTRRPRNSKDYIPQPGKWGAFSSTAGNNRGGNAIPCTESSKWLFEDHSAPPFPIKNSFGQREGPIVYTSRDKYYNARGRNGFQNVARSIYDVDGGNVFTKSYSPYTGAPIGGILPRPYGNRDNASLKGYSNGSRMKTPRLSTRSRSKTTTQYGRRRLQRSRLLPKGQRREEFQDFGPFVNQAYDASSYGRRRGRRRSRLLPRGQRKEEFQDFGPFVNQAYDASSYGQRRRQRPLYEFRPHRLRNWKPSYNSYANEDLYLNEWNPYRVYKSPKGVEKARTYNSKTNEISKASHLNFQPWSPQGSSFGPLKYGPNRVAYEDPYLMYKNPGSNTLNYLTGKQYLPPCRDVYANKLKVSPNNNPTGFLSNKRVVPISGTRNSFGSGVNHNPWVAKGKQLQRPFTTQLISTNDSATSGYTRIGQPLELYAYQNTDYGSYKYPEFLGQRAWMGGYGRKQQKQRKQRTIQKKKAPKKTAARTRRKAGPGDTLVVKNGKIKIKGQSKSTKKRPKN